jgi:hypothetical protein
MLQRLLYPLVIGILTATSPSHQETSHSSRIHCLACSEISGHRREFRRLCSFYCQTVSVPQTESNTIDQFSFSSVYTLCARHFESSCADTYLCIVNELEYNLWRVCCSHYFRVDLKVWIRPLIPGRLHLPPNLSGRLGSAIKGC